MRDGRLGHRVMERASRETHDEGASRAKRQKGSTSQSSPDDSPHAPSSPLRGAATAGKTLTPTSVGRQHSSARLWSPAAPRAQGESGDSPNVSRQPSLLQPVHRTLSGGCGEEGGAEEEEGGGYEIEESVIRVGTGYQAHVPKYQPPVSVSEEEEDALAECAAYPHTPLGLALLNALRARATTRPQGSRYYRPLGLALLHALRARATTRP